MDSGPRGEVCHFGFPRHGQSGRGSFASAVAGLSYTYTTSPPCWRAAPPWGSSRHSTEWSGAPSPGAHSRARPMPLGSGCCTVPAPGERETAFRGGRARPQACSPGTLQALGPLRDGQAVEWPLMLCKRTCWDTVWVTGCGRHLRQNAEHALLEGYRFKHIIVIGGLSINKGNYLGW